MRSIIAGESRDDLRVLRLIAPWWLRLSVNGAASFASASGLPLRLRAPLACGGRVAAPPRGAAWIFRGRVAAPPRGAAWMFEGGSTSRAVAVGPRRRRPRDEILD